MSPLKSENLLTAEQQAAVCRVTSIGCDRETACLYAYCSLGDLRRQLEQDDAFAEQLARAEATAEVNYMSTIHKAAQEEKNWRASVWWFERRAPERFARKADAVTSRDLVEVIEQLGEIIATEIASDSERERLIARLEQIKQKTPDAKTS